MSSKQVGNSKSYKTAAKLFSISGIIFIVVGIISGKIGIYLPIGIALFIIGTIFWQRSQKPTN